MLEEVTVNGVVYVPKQEKVEGMEYCIIRAEGAGVFAGYLKSKTGDEVELVNSRRLWYWKGAASLSELSQEGVSKPKECKFPCVEPVKTVLGVIEVTPCAERARLSIEGVPVWSAK